MVTEKLIFWPENVNFPSKNFGQIKKLAKTRNVGQNGNLMEMEI